MNTDIYIGRFAPSPSGPLHLGSLVTALGSYLQAKSLNGKWLLRIDDIDPPRTVSGAIEEIQSTLLVHGLRWDNELVLQSNNSHRYEAALHTLIQSNQVYPCECTRAQIKATGGYYSGVCREKTQVRKPYSMRFKHDHKIARLADGYLGEVDIDPTICADDFIVKRKDGLYAYHLASVADDIAMGITEIVRGEDLLLPTACQWSLFLALDATPPKCMHLPLVTFDDGRKFSKQNNAPALDLTKPRSNLIQALSYLHIAVSDDARDYALTDLLRWAVEQWQSKRLPVQDHLAD